MQCNSYEKLINKLANIFSESSPLVSGNGARFRFNNQYVITVYQNSLAEGNIAEIAFKPGFLIQDTNIEDLTNRDVNLNPRFRWSRVGISTESDIQIVVEFLEILVAQK